MGIKSTVKRPRRKPTDPPAKPYPEFPLWPHPSGHWAKKIRGRTVYFGAWAKRVDGKLVTLPDGGNYTAAKDQYNAEIHDIQADLKVGRKPRTGGSSATNAGGLSVGGLCNKYLTSQLRKLDAGELKTRTFADCEAATKLLVREFGAGRLVESLEPADFEALRTTMSKRWGVHRRGKFVQITRSVFKYGSDNLYIGKKIAFGSEFKKPTKKTVRLHKSARGKKLFTVDELRLVLDALDGKEVTITKKGKPTTLMPAPNPQLRSIVLLALNGGLGNTDIGNLEFTAVDIDGGWIDYPRPKTGLPRRFPLWEETVQAVRLHLASRREPKSKADENCVFLNRAGARMVQEHRQDSQTDAGITAVKIWNQDYVSSQFRSLLTSLCIRRRGLSFYALRHTFATIALQTGDRDCVKSIMGHADDDMLEIYNEDGPNDERRVRVVSHVRTWLFGK